MSYTSGPWEYNKEKMIIESVSAIFYEDGEDKEMVQVISVRAAMGGEDTNSDIKLICVAPEMLELLIKIKETLNTTRLPVKEEDKKLNSLYWACVKLIDKAT